MSPIFFRSRTRSQTRRRGFTLVELLVVIGIIALLISILLPALSKGRKSAMKVKCMNNLRSAGQLFFVYASQNKGFLPCGVDPKIGAQSGWIWDIPIKTRDLIVSTGGLRRMLYCPEFPDQDANELWNFTPDFAVLGYIFLIDRGYPGAKPHNFQPQTLVLLANQDRVSPLQLRTKDPTGKTERLLPAADTELAADAIPANASTTDPYKTVFGGVNGGWTKGTHQVSHMGTNGKPEGANVLFMDGHVIFRAIGDIHRRTDSGPYFWF